ncbi:MAG TPA: methylmalonyl Co-A mutase-associated GTPase MeaB [Candidatus Aminicenantes bacterium]|nr:methylmalonyl Co-A mutase-associated GTPase MeaB [Candidatus Aminicenantes bacterium]
MSGNKGAGKDVPEADQAGRPDWAPVDAGPQFAVRVVRGRATGSRGSSAPAVPRRSLTAAEYAQGVIGGNRTILARAITLVESNAERHRRLAREVLARVLPHTGGSVRIGLSGVPGAGKSSLIETLGNQLVTQGKRLAVLAVDPSSTITRGSILGDKTRMETLARNRACFIRPSPAGGNLGGVARKSRETILLCEAAGYDVIVVETVGVGQNEVTVRSMVDFFLLLLIAGGGDELQGIKKGVIEIADALVINKADGDNQARAAISRQEYAMALGYLSPITRGWQTRAHVCSARTGMGVAELWRMVQRFLEITRANGFFAERRQAQSVEWFHTLLDDSLRDLFRRDPVVAARLPDLERAVAQGAYLVPDAVDDLLRTFQPAPGRRS